MIFIFKAPLPNLFPQIFVAVINGVLTNKHVFFTTNKELHFQFGVFPNLAHVLCSFPKLRNKKKKKKITESEAQKNHRGKNSFESVSIEETVHIVK